jgi:hypothetical protein
VSSPEQLGRLGALAQIVLAAIIGIPSWLLAHGAPEALPRGVALFLVYALPGVIAWIGVSRGSKALLAAAALVDLPGSILAFSGATLVFLMPAILLADAAVRIPSRRDGVADVARAAAIGALEVVLIVGAGIAMLFITRPICWITTQTQTGTSVQVVPFIEGVEMGGDTGVGCTSAAITPEGVAIGLLLAAAALGLAWFSSSRRRGATDPSGQR